MAKEETKKTKKSSTAKTAEKKTTKSSTAKKSTPTKSASKSSTSKNEKKAPAKTTTKSNKTTTIVQEENNFGRTILAIIIIMVIFVGGYLGIKYKQNSGTSKEEEYVATEDEARFKKEYESLNGTTRSNGHKNKEISIVKDNNIKYVTLSEAYEIIDSGSGIIYFGFAACPWCRNATPILLSAMGASELDTIYYVDVRPNDNENEDVRDKYVLDSKNKARKSKDADQAYYNILLALADELDEYTLTTDKGKKVSTGEKRLNAPTVVAIKDGVVIDFHAGTVENHQKDETGELHDLTKEEETTLFNTYSSMISKYLGSGCQEDGC